VTVERINWQTAASQGAQVVYGVLIAGIPHLLVGDGVTVSTVAWTDTADPAWHAGTSPTSRPWLALDELTVEERIRPVDGGIDVSSISLKLADIGGGVTALLGACDAMDVSTLTTGISATATSIGVRSTAAFPSSGVLHIGRERITYTGKTGTSVTGCTRGTAGTKARRHQVTQGFAPPRVFEGDALPFTLGRRVTVWALQLSGTTVTDPTLIYDGRVGPGTRMSDAGAAWEIPLDHASKALAEETRAVEVMIYGFGHFSSTSSTSDLETVPDAAAYTPLRAEWAVPGSTGAYIALSTQEGGGWTASVDLFKRRWNDAARAAMTGTGWEIQIGDDERPFVDVRTNSPPAGAGRRLTVSYGWAAPGENAHPGDRASTLQEARCYLAPFPEACVWMVDRVHLDSADAAVIPSAPSPGGSGVFALWGLEMERDNGVLDKATLRVSIGGITGNLATGVIPLDSTGAPVPGSPGTSLYGAEVLLTKPTRAALRLSVQNTERATGWWDAVRYGVLQSLDDLRGLDHLADSVGWERVGAVARGQQPWSPQRRYWITPESAPMQVLRDEAALSGLMVCTWRGRIAVARVREPSSTETVTRTIGQADLRRGQLPTMREVRDGIITGVKIRLPPYGDEDWIRIVDATAMSESGSGAEIEVRLARGATAGDGFNAITRNPGLRTAMETTAMSLIAPWARPYRLVTVPTDLRAADVEVGDVIALDEWLLPSGTGTRGISGRGVVVGWRRSYTTGRVDLMLRVSAALAGWAPAYAVNSITSTALTLDDPYPTGPAGFATEYTSTGALRTDLGLEYLVAGDEVRLVEVGNRSPFGPQSFTVVSTDPSLKQITLSTAPGGTWATLASSSYGKVLLIPETHANSLTSQRLYAYTADGTSITLSTGDRARTWT
jgi:hypothetical protein